MTGLGRLFACAAAVALTAPAFASAQVLMPITGSLDKPGYTVIAVAAGGEALSATAPEGAFSLVPPAATTTLHLRAPDGAYAGPVVVREKVSRVVRARAAVARARARLAKAKGPRRKAMARRQLTRARRDLRAARKWVAARSGWDVVGVKAGATLGTVTIDAARGFAVTSLGTKGFRTGANGARLAQAAAGAPIGAGNVGLVGSPRSNGATVGDVDFDGVPDTLDVDDDGDLVLDDYDRPATTARAAQTSGTFPDGSHLRITTALGSQSSAAPNASAQSTAADIAAMQRRFGTLSFHWVGLDQGSAEVDCGALTWCAKGGTGAFGLNAVPPAGSRDDVKPFPGDYDADGDGQGSLVPGGPSASMPDPGAQAMGIYHGATSDELRAGDVVILNGTVNGVPVQSAATVGFVFGTFPALAGYDDGQGNAGPLTPPYSGAKLPVRAGPDGRIVLRLTFWRPQRARIAGDAGTTPWMDVGNLSYTAYGSGVGNHPNCAQPSYSAPSTGLVALTSSPMPKHDSTAGGFADTVGDRPQDAGSTFSFTLDVTTCMVTPPAVGEGTSIGFTAVADGQDGQFFTSSWITFIREA